MRAVAVFLAVALCAQGAVIDARDDPSTTPFDKREAASFTGILQSDVLAGIAAINQQIYQATSAGSQWKKCNPMNIVVRREWYALSGYLQYFVADEA